MVKWRSFFCISRGKARTTSQKQLDREGRHLPVTSRFQGRLRGTVESIHTEATLTPVLLFINNKHNSSCHSMNGSSEYDTYLEGISQIYVNCQWIILYGHPSSVSMLLSKRYLRKHGRHQPIRYQQPFYRLSNIQSSWNSVCMFMPWYHPVKWNQLGALTKMQDCVSLAMVNRISYNIHE